MLFTRRKDNCVCRSMKSFFTFETLSCCKQTENLAKDTWDIRRPGCQVLIYLYRINGTFSFWATRSNGKIAHSSVAVSASETITSQCVGFLLRSQFFFCELLLFFFSRSCLVFTIVLAKTNYRMRTWRPGSSAREIERLGNSKNFHRTIKWFVMAFESHAAIAIVTPQTLRRN